MMISKTIPYIDDFGGKQKCDIQQKNIQNNGSDSSDRETHTTNYSAEITNKILFQEEDIDELRKRNEKYALSNQQMDEKYIYKCNDEDNSLGSIPGDEQQKKKKKKKKSKGQKKSKEDLDKNGLSQLNSSDTLKQSRIDEDELDRYWIFQSQQDLLLKDNQADEIKEFEKRLENSTLQITNDQKLQLQPKVSEDWLKRLKEKVAKARKTL